MATWLSEEKHLSEMAHYVQFAPVFEAKLLRQNSGSGERMITSSGTVDRAFAGNSRHGGYAWRMLKDQNREWDMTEQGKREPRSGMPTCLSRGVGAGAKIFRAGKRLLQIHPPRCGHGSIADARGSTH